MHVCMQPQPDPAYRGTNYHVSQANYSSLTYPFPIGISPKCRYYTTAACHPATQRRKMQVGAGAGSETARLLHGRMSCPIAGYLASSHAELK